MKEYILKPIMTPATLNLTPKTDKSAVIARAQPQAQPLPRAVMDASKPQLKLGLDVHLQRMVSEPTSSDEEQ